MEKTSLEEQTCYACPAPAVSWEHAPPEGYFPRKKETLHGPKGRDYRRNLIQVPSCRLHNEAKSHRDSYVMAVIGYIARVYAPYLSGAELHPFVETIRRRAHSQKLLRDTIEPQPDGGRAITVEQSYVAEMMEFVARALYYHEHQFNRRWPGPCQVIDSHVLPLYPDPLRPDVNAADFFAENLDYLRRQGQPGYDLKGAHPDVFGYQLYEALFGRVVIEMRFYGALTFYALGDRP